MHSAGIVLSGAVDPCRLSGERAAEFEKTNRLRGHQEVFLEALEFRDRFC